MLKLKVRKFWRLSLTFVEVTKEKLVGGGSLLLVNSISSHYVLIKDFNRFMTKIKYHGKKYFCRCCLQCFSNSRECHIKNCLAIHHTKSVLLPEENDYVNFQNSKRLAKAPS